MGLFICAKCNCIENTMLGLYWTRKNTEDYIFDKTNEQFKGEALCSECAPKYFSNGSKTEYGKWHGRFPKQDATDFLKINPNAELKQKDKNNIN